MNTQKLLIQRIGIVLMLVALLVNPFFLGFMFSADNHIDTPLTIVVILCFEVFLFVLGLGVYKYELLHKYNLTGKLLLLFFSFVLCFAALEISISILGEYDVDGQFSFGGRDLKPYVLPADSMEKYIEEFENLTHVYVMPDPYLGWTVGNNASALRPLGYYKVNSIGARSDREFNITKNNETLRIAMFGDSFVHSYDVPMNDTLAFYTEKQLSPEKTTEVMNFGVGAYGIDQAYLRWKLLGSKYHPDIVIIGFQAENCKRNTNIIRRFYFRGTQIPFSKPRFILENGTLVLVNHPTVPYQDVPDIVRNFEHSNLSQYEPNYDPADYTRDNPLFYSKLIRYVVTRIDEHTKKKRDPTNYQMDSETGDLCYSIIKKFYNEASVDSEVYVLHLPTIQDLGMKVSLQPKGFVYEELLSRLKDDFRVIDPTDDLVHEAEENTLQSLFVGHYSGRANEIVAKSVTKTIRLESEKV